MYPATLLAAAALAAAATPMLAQQTFRAGVDLVHFAVVVTDRQGSPIEGLTRDDFEIIEEGGSRRSATSPPETTPAARSARACRCTSGSRSTPAAAWNATSTPSAPR
jgi:hypothetical protein